MLEKRTRGERRGGGGGGEEGGEEGGGGGGGEGGGGGGGGGGAGRGGEGGREGGGGGGESMAVVGLVKTQLRRVRGEIERETVVEKDHLQKLQVREYGNESKEKRIVLVVSVGIRKGDTVYPIFHGSFIFVTFASSSIIMLKYWHTNYL